MLFAALSVIDAGAVRPAANESPPVAEEMFSAFAVMFAPTAEVTEPLEERLNVAPAPDAALILVALLF